jgi:hypothetical protein
MLCGVYPEFRIEILHFVQDDSEGLTMTGKGFAACKEAL